MLRDLAAEDDAEIDAVFACPHHREGRHPYDHLDHPARKPRPGMLLRAADALDLDLSASWIVGDHATDIEAGLNAGLAGGIHVLTGHGGASGQRADAIALASSTFRVEGAPSIAEAADVLPLLAAGSAAP
jgi:D-glycero-D-manno-heptose 1,7-bisphosphate phosphatase